MKKKMVRHTLETLPLAAEAQNEQIKILAGLTDGDINYDDIPRLSATQLAEFQRPEHYRPVKQQITTRLDADVIAWLKSGGKGYQSRMNAILRRVMVAESK